MSENQNYQQQSGYPYQMYPYYYPQTSPAYYPAYHPVNHQQPSQTTDERQVPTQQGVNVQGMLPMQQSYIENILRLNKGKQVTVHMTFEYQGGTQKTFTGILEAAGRDHIIISDPNSGERFLLLMVYLDYVTFNEEINYQYPFDNTGMLSNYPSR